MYKFVVFANFGQVKKYCHFGDFGQVEKYGHFADFGQVKKNIVVLLTLGKSLR